MKITNFKKNRSSMKKIGAIVMAASIGCVSFGISCYIGKPSTVAKEATESEETKSSVVVEDSLFNITPNSNNIREVILTTSVKTNTTTTKTSTVTNTTSPISVSTIPSTTLGISNIVTTVASTTSEATFVSTTETEKTTEETVEETTETEVATTVEEVEQEPVREYVVYKPSTHYIHRSTCRWFNSECYEISDTEGLECRMCTECNPEMDIVTEYVVQQPSQPSTPVNTGNGYYSLNFITDTERIYLCNTVGAEWGSDWVSLYDKACVVATVMNRVYDGGWSNGLPSTVYNVLTAPYQYNPAYAVPYYCSNVTQSCIDAVEYYFENQSIFPHYTSFYGDGYRNYFR